MITWAVLVIVAAVTLIMAWRYAGDVDVEDESSMACERRYLDALDRASARCRR